MTSVIFIFAGTRDTAKNMAENLDNKFISPEPEQDDVIRIYVDGCQHSHVGGSIINPDFNIVSNNIKKSFNNAELDIEKLKNSLGTAIVIKGPRTENPIKVEQIGLYGFSRGAVTTYAVAKNLDDLNIPIDIIANQPVPGQAQANKADGPYKRYHDLSECKSIRSVFTYLASYNLENGIFENKFYKQMVPKLPKHFYLQRSFFGEQSGVSMSISCQPHCETILLPHQQHLQSSKDNTLINWYIQNNLLEKGYTRMQFEDNYEKTLQAFYDKVYFTPKEFCQEIFGEESGAIKRDSIYLNMIQEKASKYLGRTDNVSLNDDQALAIVAICGNKQILDLDKEKFIEFVLDPVRGEAFTSIVCQTYEVNQYLTHSTKNRIKNTLTHTFKSKRVETASEKYMNSILKHSYAFLNKENPQNNFEKEQFKVNINKANRRYIKSSLGIERNKFTKAFKFLSTVILVACGITMVSNALKSNFFKTRSVKLLEYHSNKFKKKYLNTKLTETTKPGEPSASDEQGRKNEKNIS